MLAQFIALRTKAHNANNNNPSPGLSGQGVIGDMMFKQILLGAALMLFSLSSFGADMLKGKALSTQCSVCHGQDGIAKDPESPNLAGLSSLYIEKTLLDYQKGLREDRRMSIIAKSLSIEDIKDLAAWYSAFEITVKEPSM